MAPAATGLLRAAQAPPDMATDSDGIEYWFLGNGRLMAALQTVRKPESATHCGLILLSPEHIVSKHATLLFNESRGGLAPTRFFVETGGSRHFAGLDASVEWRYPSGIPAVVIRWRAGNLEVQEELLCLSESSALVRTVRVRNTGTTARQVIAGANLQPNKAFFEGRQIDAGRGIVTYTGYHRLEFFGFTRVRASEAGVTADFGELAPGAAAEAVFGYALDDDARALIAKGPAALREESAASWRAAASLSTGSRLMDHLHRTSQTGLRAHISRTGKMNSGLFQYGGEWVRDSTICGMGAVLAGLPGVGRAILERLLVEKVDPEGRCWEYLSFRPDELMELDQNAVLTHGVWTHWVWTGSDDLVRKHWEILRRLADFPLRPAFRDPATGLLKSAREFWERHAMHGFSPGYELAYQVWNVIGLRSAAEMAAHMGDSAARQRWTQASTQLRKAILEDPRFSLVENGRFIKRRLANGEPQYSVVPPDRSKMPASMPLHFEKVSRCDPDSTQAYPILFEIVDPRGPVARRTLDALEALWNQRWSGGGYGRYDVTSEPDSPGSWPPASMLIAQAALAAGDHEKVWRTLRWLGEVSGGRSGAWFEFYGDRPVPPLPRIGILPWTLGEMQIFFVTHLLGVRPAPGEIVVRPRLLAGLKKMEARLPLNGHILNLTVQAAGEWSARLDGKPVAMADGALRMPRPARDTTLEIQTGTLPE